MAMGRAPTATRRSAGGLHAQHLDNLHLAQGRRLRRVVTLKELGTHKDKELSDMALFRYKRLSVQPVQPGEWEFILGLEDEPSENGVEGS